MSYWVLTVSAKVVSCVTVQRLTLFDMLTDEYARQIELYDKHVNEKLDTNDSDLEKYWLEVPDWNRISLDEDDD